jgi:hypothetical protein
VVGRALRTVLCLGLSLVGLLSQGCMIAGHKGGGGGGGGMGVPPPTLTSLSPSTAVVGGPAFTLTVNGSGFVAGGTLSWNTTDLGQYTLVSSTQVTIQIGAGFITLPGMANITASIPSEISPSNFLPFTVNGFTSSACVLFGSYNFFFNGFDTSGPVTIAGQFGVDANGNVNGEEDFKDLAGTHAAQAITGGSCANNSTTNEGTISLTTAMGTSHYTFAAQVKPSPGVKGQMAESGDSNGISGSGRFNLAQPGSFLSGDYVMAVIGADASGGRMGILGRFTDSNTSCGNCSGTLSAGVGDSNDNGSLTQSASISGTIAAPDLFSRSLVSVQLGSQTLQFAFYVIASQLAFAVEVDSGNSSPLLAGFVGSQANAGLYANNHLNAPVVFSTWGAMAGVPASSDTSIGLASGFSSAGGTFDLLLDSVASGMANLNQTVAATYQIASTGRATVSYNAGGKIHNLVLYLDGQNDGYILDSSASVAFGFFGAQSSGPFSNSTLNGNYAGGTWFSPTAISPNFTGMLTLNNGNITGDVTGTYSVDSASGRGTATLSLPVFGSDNVVFYIVAPNNFMIMGSDPVNDDTIGFLHL